METRRPPPQSSHPTFVSSQLMKYRSLDQPFFVEMSFSQHVRCECKWVLGCGRDSPHTPGGISQGLPIRAAVCASSLADGGQGNRGPVAAQGAGPRSWSIATEKPQGQREPGSLPNWPGLGTPSPSLSWDGDARALEEALGPTGAGNGIEELKDRQTLVGGKGQREGGTGFL